MFLLFLAIVVVACIGRRSSGWRRSWARPEDRRPDWSDSPRRESPSTEERFEEWHRKVHADEPAGEPTDTHI